MPVYIADSFAILAYFGEEKGAERIEELFDLAQQKKIRVVISIINLGEILYITERRQGLAKAQEMLAATEQLPIEVLPATQKRVLDAAHIKANYPVSYTDAFAIAATQELDATVLTDDPEFSMVEKIIRVEWL